MTALPLDFFLSPIGDRAERLRGRRIVLFTGAFNHIADGVSLTLNRLVAYLESQGAHVLVFAPTVDNPPIEHAGTLVPVRSMTAPGRSDYRVSWWLSADQQRRLEAFDPHLMHIATPDILGLHALRLARRLRIPVVASYHTHFVSYLGFYRLGVAESVLWRYLRWFYRRVRHLYVPTPTMAQVLEANGIDRGLRLWPRGVETSHFRPSRRDMSWRRSLGIADDEVVVSFISRLVWEKSPQVFADTIDLLLARGLKIRALIVGDGPAGETLRERMPAGVFAGVLRDDELACAYASSEIFLFPSETETFGNVTLEAMASGIPTVCADAAGSDALVRHGETGFLAPAGDAKAFADAVAALVEDPALRQRMGKAAAREAERYSWDSVLARMARYYDDALTPVGAPTRRPLPVPEARSETLHAQLSY